MATYLVLPNEIISSAQREKVNKMMREMQDYRMKPEEDIIQHIITRDINGTGPSNHFRPTLEDIDPIKFTEMELVDDEDVETMIALYCGNESDKNTPIHLW
ncbi:hypothetical protein GOBAR_AA06667 [Gossypium barbadense]|uniref:Uncharacterized protein n=1 Tax=Gossypium barbadense TaxID=3634 RepID=A0A2P5YE76_GOSBA|nr:hypothetical protein GOBAR_AA06667 [Gossypium barbadense]